METFLFPRALEAIQAALGSFNLGSGTAIVVNRKVAFIPVIASATLIVIAQENTLDDSVSTYLLNDEGSVISLYTHLSWQWTIDVLQDRLGYIAQTAAYAHKAEEWRDFSIASCLQIDSWHFLKPCITSEPTSSTMRNLIVPLVNECVLVITVQSSPEVLVHFFDIAIISPHRGEMVIFERGLNMLNLRNFIHDRMPLIRAESI